MSILLPLVFLSGILTAFSPCVLPVLPIVLASGIDGNKKRVNGTIFGLIVSFSIATLALSGVVSTLNISADTLRNFSVAILVILGLVLLFDVWKFIQQRIEKYFQQPSWSRGGQGFWGGFVSGVALGIVWTPCVGPILAAVSTLAALNKFSLFTVVLAFTYSLGIGLPLWLVARYETKFVSRLNFFKTNPVLVRQVFGAVIIFTALFIYSGFEKRFQEWTLDNLPEEWTQLATTFEDRFEIKDELSDLQEGTKENVEISKQKTGAKVNPDDLIQGCFGGKDCIPSIDDPKFESAGSADSWLRPDDKIFGVNFNGIQRVYPQRILNWHEIVNDWFGEDPVAVTFCPLCGTATSFIRKVNGEIAEFGVSGKLYNSDLVMYDRNEGSLWQQATGEGIVGPAAERDEFLEFVSTTTTTWEKWKQKYPETIVLSINTGFVRDYDRYPYGSYEENGEIYFGLQNTDNRLHPKEVVYGILVNGQAKAYTEEKISEVKNLEDVVGGVNVVVEWLDSGEVRIVNRETQEEIIPLRGFWFAWAAFYPDTELFN